MKLIQINIKKVFILVSFLVIVVWITMSYHQVDARKTAHSPFSGGPFPQTTLFTDISGHPSSDVPGYPGVVFSSIQRISVSPNGNWIIFAGLAGDLQFGTPRGLLVNGEVKVLEDREAPWTDNTEDVEFFKDYIDINNSGEWIASVNTDASNTADDYIIHVSTTDVYTYHAKEGDPIPQLPGATWDDDLSSTVISNDGVTGWSADEIDGVPTSEDGILVYGNSVLAQQNVTIPSGQAGNQPMQNFDSGFFFISANGNDWLVKGDLTGDQSMDGVVIVDGMVVAQEGVILPNSVYSNPIEEFHRAFMAPNGDWFVHGTNSVSGHDWLYRNGEVIADQDMPIYEGATEVFSDAASSITFGNFTGDSFGNYVIGGATDNPDLEANRVLVVNNETVIARKGDPVDLNNDGIFNDNAYFDIFRPRGFFLDNSGNLYFVATLMDSSNFGIGDGIFIYDLSAVIETPIVYMPFAANRD